MKTGKRIFIIITMGLMMNSIQTVAQTWKPLGNGVPAKIDITCLDSNNNLYVAYRQDTILNLHDTCKKITVAKWDGINWTHLKPFICWKGGWDIFGMAYYKEELILIGGFDSIIGIGSVHGVIKFNGNSWVSFGNLKLGGGSVHQMLVYINKLYITGGFNSVNGVTCNKIACWDGVAWQPLGIPGYDGVDYGITQMKIINNRLIICGTFNWVGPKNDTCSIAEWDGSKWSVYKPKLYNLLGINYYRGKFIGYGLGIVNQNIEAGYFMLDSFSWKYISKELDRVSIDLFHRGKSTFCIYQDMIWAWGYFRFIGDTQIYQMVIWNGSNWIPYSGLKLNPVANFDPGQYIDNMFELGGQLIITGKFDTINGIPCKNIAYYNSSISNISGNVFYDKNTNCIKDVNEPGLSSFLVEIQPGPHYACSDTNGNYCAYVDTGSYTVRLVEGLGKYKYWYLSSCNPGYYNIKIDSTSADSNNNFGYAPKPNIDDLRIFIIGQNGFRARPGRTESYSIEYENIGTKTISSGTVNLKLDNRVVLKTSNPNYDSYTHPNLTWSFSDLKPLEKRTIRLMIKVDSSISVNDTIIYTASILPLIGDSDITNNFDTLKQRIVTAVDPNDKQCSPDGNILPQTSKIDYIIRFQNTGNHVAYRVRVIDTVTEKLPLTKILLKTTSHPYELKVEDNVITWTFNNIMLPDSNSDEPNSHGYISYTAFIKPGLALGTKITNKAYIYFDYQSPVITKATENVIALPSSIDEHTIIENKEYKVYPNPASGHLNIIYLGKNQKQELSLVNSFGQIISSLTLRPDEKKEIDISKLPNGLYLIRDFKDGYVNKIIVNH